MEPAKLYVGVKGIIVRNGALLVLEKMSDVQGLKSAPFWDLPGGRMGYRETIEDALARELREELPSIGQFSIGPLLGVRKKERVLSDGTELFLVYYAIQPEPFEVNLSEEHTRFAWMNLQDLSQIAEPMRTVYSSLLEKALQQ